MSHVPAGDAAPAPPAPPHALFARSFGAVLFDMDGTLIDSLASVRRSWTTWAAEHGIGPSALAHFHGVPARQIVAQLLPDGDQAAAFARIEELEVADVAGIAVLPGALEALHAVGGRGAIVTSCTRPLATARIAETRLPVPTGVITASDVRHGKPDPEPYLAGAGLLGVPPGQCLVVEDAPSGVRAGHAAGAAVLGVRTGEESPTGADVLVGGLADVRFEVGPDGVWVLPA